MKTKRQLAGPGQFVESRRTWAPLATATTTSVASSGASSWSSSMSPKLAQTAIKYPPMQEPASFDLDEVKKKIEAVMKQHEGE